MNLSLRAFVLAESVQLNEVYRYTVDQCVRNSPESFSSRIGAGRICTVVHSRPHSGTQGTHLNLSLRALVLAGSPRQDIISLS